MKPNLIILIGFMGTGKSSVAQALSERLGWKVFDTDELIVEESGKSIPEIFAQHGEAYFRELESRVLHNVLDGSDKIVSTGGGSVLAEHNRRLMLHKGCVIGLSADAETIIQRVSHDENRPLLQGDVRERVHHMLEARKGAYDFAHYTIDTSSLSPIEIAERIIQFIAE